MVKGQESKRVNNSTVVFGYKKLLVYQKARTLVILIYKITTSYPKTELYALVPQMRRAAISIMANIVEGYSKESSAEYARFLTIAIGSLTELEVFLEISLDLGFINSQVFDKIILELLETKKLLYTTRRSIRSKIFK